MPFPQPSEYDDAIQNPATAFIDVGLQQGVNDGPLRFGMPGPVASGNFAVVYRFRCGTERYAVKCFTRQPPKDQTQRFSSIHNHLIASRLNCATGFQFLPRGIRIRGMFYPVLKMEWLDAPTLLEFVPRNIHDRDSFRQLSEAFLLVCEELRKNEIAHGDLQHGNLLVSAGGLKIIDYDGMCVPGTAGLPSEEDGLPHYQHPCRQGGRLAPNFDHFPSLVIWISLYALSLDPSLWGRHVREEERLLFRKDDFSNPQGSALFRELLSYRDERLSKAVNALLNACGVFDLAQIPPLTDIVSSESIVVDPDWWREQVPSVPGATSNEPKIPIKNAPPDWMQPELPPPLPARFGYSMIWDRVFAYAYISAFAVGGVGAYAGTVPTSLLVVGSYTLGALVGWRLLASYRATPALAEKVQCAKSLRHALAQLADYETQIQKWISEQESIIVNNAKPVEELETRLAQLQADSRQRQVDLDLQLRAILQKLSSECQQIDSKERYDLQKVNEDAQKLQAAFTDRLRCIDADYSRINADTSIQINELNREKVKSKDARLKSLCDDFVRAELMKIPISASSIASLTESNVFDLRNFGIRYAGDFINCSPTTRYGASYPVYLIVKADGSRVKVPGIGAKRADSLMEWRREHVQRTLRRAPSALPQNIVDAIDREIEERQKILRLRVSRAAAEATQLRNQAQESNKNQVAELRIIEAQIRQTAMTGRSSLKTRENQERQIAESHKAEALGLINREIWQLQSIIGPAKHKVDKLKSDYQKLLAGTTEELRKLRISVSSYERELSIYRNIRWQSYLLRVFAFAKE
jgi:hypothetical protein